MAKGKSLLTESEVRKFMKFANIPHLAENFFKEGMYEEEGMYEGDMEETMHSATDEMVHEEEEAVEEPVAEEPPADMDMGDEAGGLEAEAERVLGDLAALLSKAGVPVSVAGDKVEEPPADDMGDMGDEVEELEEMGAYDEEALAESVLKRVMARVKGLNEAKERKAKLAKRVDEVTDRIMKRITR